MYAIWLGFENVPRGLCKRDMFLRGMSDDHKEMRRMLMKDQGRSAGWSSSLPLLLLPS
jgi:hypothetical protein